jgi:hypothetical protein
MSYSNIHITKLGTEMLREGTDLTDLYEAMKPVLAPALFKELGAVLELCPIHCCDFQICVDDGIHGDEVYTHEL